MRLILRGSIELHVKIDLQDEELQQQVTHPLQFLHNNFSTLYITVAVTFCNLFLYVLKQVIAG